MTPFGQRMRDMRRDRNVTQKEMARAIGVSAAYLSALESGRRGRPTWALIQKVIGYFNIIWDDAEDLIRLAERSHPKVVIDTGGLSPVATELANLLASRISSLSDEEMARIAERIRGGGR
jgi:transcriptional regulator with XRE-family HTH domain